MTQIILEVCINVRQEHENEEALTQIFMAMCFRFASVYDGSSGQREIFESCVRPLLAHALRGENVSIFAYGPTGAGETFDLG